ncbi:siderophore-interacting protein [Nocardioides stalactiti]|uniref:siderophore-interacting protein n=1 Tax=Nocardioides stalactiti TaxID=2755356 RepID=UPI001FE7BE33|nr:siderophore-interacting protein [Nocardioides stalactiti]
MTTTTNAYVASLPMVLTEVEVSHVERVSPSYVRLELGGSGLAECGRSGPLLDQRMKIVFPNAAGALPSFAGMDSSWWDTWLAIPEDERGSIRTYTVRDLVGSGVDTRIVVDVVVHDPDEHSGPGNDWALQASVGDRVIVLAPRLGHEFGGIEWSPGSASRLLLVGDETAVPAIRGILRDLPDDASGAAFLEVPFADDVQRDVVAPDGVEITWIPRGDAMRGASLHAAVVAWLTGAAAAAPTVGDDEVDPDLWETPVYSSSGEEVAAATQVPADTPHAGLYAWIAGESKVVTGLRRRLVNELGVDRGQVAFMGYWREGVAMRS